MRIYNVETDKKANKIVLYLTRNEAEEMKNSLEAMLVDERHHHEHISDSNYEKEITVCIYREDNLSGFDERSKKLILNDE